ncbi:MAG: ArnT family glycosyltransferase [Aggregatilineales bacterium]
MYNRAALFSLLHRLLLAAALAILAFYLVVYLAYAANLLSFPFDYDQGEGFELVDTILFSQGRWPYMNTEVFPFYSSNYPPLFHVLAAPLVSLFGPGYWHGRLLGFLATLVTATAIGFAVYREGSAHASRRAYLAIAVLSGLAYLASNTVYHIGPLFRQHATMVMFETLAVVVLAWALDIVSMRQRRAALLTGLLLIVAAGYTKQLAAVTLAAAAVFLFLRGPLRAVFWIVLAGVVGAAIFVWINAATDGEWWRQAILANVNELYILQTIGLFRQWIGLHGFLIAAAVLLTLYELYFDRLSLYSVWFVLAVVINGSASGTWGGGDSYFATAIAAVCVLSGVFAARTLCGHWRFPENYLSRRLVEPLRPYASLLRTASLLIIPLLYIGYGRAVLHLPTQEPGFSQVAQLLQIQPNAQNGFYDSARTADGHYPSGYADIGHFVTAADAEAGWRIVEMIAQSEKPVLSEEAGFVLQAGREVITNPTQLLNLDKKGLYDGSALIEMIERQEFGLVILRAQFYPERVLQAIGRAYRHTGTVRMNGFNYLILRPAEAATERVAFSPKATTRAE